MKSTTQILEEQAERIAELEQDVADRDAVLADKRRLAREIDIIINGEKGAATQASLCDLVGQISDLARLQPVVGYSLGDDPETQFYDPHELAEHVESEGGDEPGFAYGLIPWHRGDLEFYATVPDARVDRREWSDGMYLGNLEIIGPFKTESEAKAAGGRVTAKRMAEWEKQEEGETGGEA